MTAPLPPVGYQMLVEGAAYRVDRDAGQFEVTGPDAAACVNRVVTADLSRLAPGGGTPTLLLRDDGSVLARLALYRFADRILLVSAGETREAVWRDLVAHKRGQVRLRDISAETTFVAVRGPAAATLLAAAIVPLPAEAGAITAARCGGVQLFAAHAMPGGPDGVDCFCRQRDEAALLDALRAAGVAEASDEAWEMQRIEWGDPAVGVEIDPADTPVEAGLEELVLEGKGAPFPGEFAVAARRRSGPMKRIAGVRILGDSLPPAGANVEVGGLGVGRLRSAVHSPRAGMIGIVALPASAVVPGTPVTISLAGRSWRAEVVRRPFVSRSLT